MKQQLTTFDMVHAAMGKAPKVWRPAWRQSKHALTDAANVVIVKQARRALAESHLRSENELASMIVLLEDVVAEHPEVLA